MNIFIIFQNPVKSIYPFAPIYEEEFMNKSFVWRIAAALLIASMVLVACAPAATEAPAAEAPAAEAPAAEAPAVEAPAATEAPAVEAPAAEAPLPKHLLLANSKSLILKMASSM